MKNLQSVSKKIVAMLVSGATIATVPIYASYPIKKIPVSIVSDQYVNNLFNGFLKNSLFSKNIKKLMIKYLTNNSKLSVTEVLNYSAELTTNLLRKGRLPYSFRNVIRLDQEFIGCKLLRYINEYKFDDGLSPFYGLYVLTLEYIFAVYYYRDHGSIHRFENVKFDFPDYSMSRESFETFRKYLAGKLHDVLIDIL